MEHAATVDLYIDRGKGCDSENKQIFDQLFKNKNVIESSFGSALEWRRLDDKRASRISKKIFLGGYRDEQKWDEIQSQMIDEMIRLEKALKPFFS